MSWVIKTAAVRVATREGDGVYYSFRDMPPEVRAGLKKALDGPYTETILIANQEAYERIQDRGEALPPEIEHLRTRLAAPGSGPPARTLDWRMFLAGASAVLLGLALLSLWFSPAGGL